jgi:signal transduction histidine kinase
MMKEASAYMSETLNDVLSIQKIEDGKLELQFDNFFIKNVLHTVCNSLKGQVDAKGITLLTSIKHNVPKEVVGDRYRIEHVLANFLSNAVKFSPEYSAIKITVSYGDRIKGCVSFTVSDQGEGIPADLLPQLFNDYMQINPGAMQQGKGTGVGLSICKVR